MSENTSCQTTAGGGPACEKESLIIEVMGNDHPEGHSFSIYDETNYEQQESLQNQVKIEALEESVLHVWPWSGQPKRNIWLEIATENDQPIRLPFLDDAGETKRQEERQHHVILPILPMELVSGVPVAGNNPSYPMLARPGWLYLFYKGKLWRELNIRQDENGAPLYHDVPLFKFRSNDGFGRENRIPTGVGLAEIWMPARVSETWQTLEVAFSEAPMPGPRLNYLESSTTARRERCEQVSMRMEEASFGLTIYQSSGRHTAFPADLAPKQRSRNFPEESQFDNPVAYLTDLAGESGPIAFKKAQAMHDRLESYDPGDPVYADERPEMTALALCFHQKVDELKQQSTETPFETELWQSDGAKPMADALQNARSRNLGALIVNDALYRYRYLELRLAAGEWALGAAAQRAEFRGHHKSALLISTVGKPSTIGEDPNPVKGYIRELPAEGQAVLSQGAAEGERKLAVEYLGAIKNLLLANLQDERSLSCLTDLFTHEGFDYAGAFNFVTGLIQHAIKESYEADALDFGQNRLPDGEGRQWLRKLCENPGDKLGQMLLPRATIEDLEKPYHPPDEAEPNRGNGRFRATALAAIESLSLPEPEELLTPDGFALLATIKRGDFATTITAPLKRGSEALLTIHGNFLASIDSATASMENADAKYQLLQAEQQQLHKQAKAHEKVRQDLEARTRRASGLSEFQQKALLEQRSQFDKASAEIEAARTSLDDRYSIIKQKAVMAKMRLYSRGLQQIRASVPSVFSGLTLQRRSKALQKDYWIIGDAENLRPQGIEPIRMYGEIKAGATPDAPMLGSTNRNQALTRGINQAAEEALVLTLPATAKSTAWIKQAVEAEQSLVAASKEFHRAEKALRTASEGAGSAKLNYDDALKKFEAAENNFKQIADDLESKRTDLNLTKVKIDEAAGDLDEVIANRAYRFLNSPFLPVFVLLVEGWNTTSTFVALSETHRKQGQIRAILGMVSAAWDVVYAGALLTERFAQNTKIGAKVKRRLSKELPGKFAKGFVERFGSRLTYRLTGGVVSGFVTAGVSVWDAAYSYRLGNGHAAFGHSLIATSGLAISIAGIVSKGAPLLVLGPGGWIFVAVGLAMAGAATVWWHEDQPIELWLRHGPFGSGDALNHLKDSETAYSRLVSLLMGVNIRLEPNTKQEEARMGELQYLAADGQTVVANANTRLVVESSLPGLFDGEVVSLDTHLQLLESRATWQISGRSSSTTPSKTERLISGAELNAYRLGEQDMADGKIIYLKTPASGSEQTTGKWGYSRIVVTRKYHWLAKTQIRIGPEKAAIVFPMPPPDDPQTYDASDDEKPDFTSEDQPFWYHHKVSLHDQSDPA